MNATDVKPIRFTPVAFFSKKRICEEINSQKLLYILYIGSVGGQLIDEKNRFRRYTSRKVN